MSNLSERIKQFRLDKNMTQKELSKKLGIYQSYISRWENGDIPCKKKHFQKLSELLNIKKDLLLVSDETIQELKNFHSDISKKIIDKKIENIMELKNKLDEEFSDLKKLL
jgi:transcriptional regulator with XRE-family HTH domain